MSGQDEAFDGPHQFFMEAHRITIEAQFIVAALPTADSQAVERITLQLDAIRTILLSLQDTGTDEADIEHLVLYVSSLLRPLEAFLAAPPVPSSSRVPRTESDAPGRPSYLLDLDRAQRLHELGNTWEDIASAMGVTRQTLYNHMAANGLSTARKEWTLISDDDLDALVSEICSAHPFIGSTIVQGHLESRDVHVPRVKVQESLRRVDAMGVLVRYVLLCFGFQILCY